MRKEKWKRKRSMKDQEKKGSLVDWNEEEEKEDGIYKYSLLFTINEDLLI